MVLAGCCVASESLMLETSRRGSRTSSDTSTYNISSHGDETSPPNFLRSPRRLWFQLRAACGAWEIGVPGIAGFDESRFKR